MVALIGVALTGCGREGSVVDLVRDAADRLERAGSVNVAIESDLAIIPDDGDSATFLLRSGGAFDLARGVGRLRGNASGPLVERPRACDTTFDRATMYLAAPMDRSVRFDTSTWSRTERVDPLFLSDPLAPIALLAAVGPTFTTLSSDVVREVRTTHYHFEVTKRDVDRTFRRTTRAWIGDALRAFQVDAFPIDAWIDASGVVRRVRLEWIGTLEGDIPGRTADATLVVAVDLYRHGAPVRVPVPRSAEAGDASSFPDAANACFGLTLP
jgi:hypothetical protein